MEISLDALVGGAKHKTIKIKRMFKRSLVITLIKSGSMHNFIDERVVHEMKCRVQTIDVGVSCKRRIIMSFGIHSPLVLNNKRV